MLDEETNWKEGRVVVIDPPKILSGSITGYLISNFVLRQGGNCEKAWTMNECAVTSGISLMSPLIAIAKEGVGEIGYTANKFQVDNSP